MSLSPDDVARIARLARIAIAPDESAQVLASLNDVIELVGQMRAVDTAGIEPMAHPLDAHFAQGQRLREDRPSEPDRRALYQSVAPAVEAGLYLVPKVIE
ncbi:MAG TPA: Asp-tRNA(Asn)/Glu-tRNA(Gln) amidotransferase subunit GatC [Burkholderiales bacterium]